MFLTLSIYLIKKEVKGIMVHLSIYLRGGEQGIKIQKGTYSQSEWPPYSSPQPSSPVQTAVGPLPLPSADAATSLVLQEASTGGSPCQIIRNTAMIF